MIVFYIIGQRGRDLHSKYSPSVRLLSFKGDRTDPVWEIKGNIPLCSAVLPPPGKIKRMSVETHIKINFASHPFSLQVMTYSCCPSFLVHEREEGRCGSFHRVSNLPPKQGLFQVAWDQIELISKPAERDL